jgi:hypothetical protein
MTHILVEYVNTPPAAAPNGATTSRNGQRTDGERASEGRGKLPHRIGIQQQRAQQQSSSASAILSATSYHVLVLST